MLQNAVWVSVAHGCWPLKAHTRGPNRSGQLCFCFCVVFRGPWPCVLQQRPLACAGPNTLMACRLWNMSLCCVGSHHDCCNRRPRYAFTIPYRTAPNCWHLLHYSRSSLKSIRRFAPIMEIFGKFGGSRCQFLRFANIRKTAGNRSIFARPAPSRLSLKTMRQP